MISLPSSSSSSSSETRKVSCRADLVRNALAPMRTGARAGGPRAPFPFGQGTASALHVPFKTNKKSSAASPSR